MDEIKAMSFQDRAKGFGKEYEVLARKWGVDLGARLFIQDLFAIPEESPIVKPTEDNIPAKVDSAVE